MDTMEITKIVGALCGSLLIFLLVQTVGGAVFTTAGEQVGYSVEVPEEEGGGGEEAPAEAVDVAALMSEADPAAGERVFNKCQACHNLDGSNAVGPHLDGVVGREISAVEGYSYSGALPEGNWTPEELSAFLENPKTYAPGTAMSFAGLPKPEDRADVIAYLEQQGG